MTAFRPVNIRPVDLGAALQGAQRIQRGQFDLQQRRANLAQQQRAAQQQAQVGQLLGASLQGDPQATQQLFQVAPERALEVMQQRQQLEGGQLEQQQQQMELQQAQRQQALSKIQRAGELLDRVIQNPQAYPMIRRVAVSQGIASPEQLPEEFPGLGALQQLKQQQEFAATALQDPGKMEAISSIGKLAVDSGLEPGTPEFQRFVQENLDKAGSSTSVTINEAGAPTARVRGELQNDLIESAASTQTIDEIRQIVKPSDFNALNAFVEDEVLPRAERLGVAKPGERLTRRQFISSTLEDLFNQYRIAVTGAAAPMRELEMLKRTFPRMDQSHSQFEGALKWLEQRKKRYARIAREILRSGDVAAGTEPFNGQVSALWGTQGRTPTFVRNRARELARQVPPARVTSSLVKEGYLTESQAERLAEGEASLEDILGGGR